MKQAFHRAMAMFQALAIAAALPITERGPAMDAIGPYKSRGHGRGKAFDKQHHGNKCTPPAYRQGERECARRRRQMGPRQS